MHRPGSLLNGETFRQFQKEKSFKKKSMSKMELEKKSYTVGSGDEAMQ